MADVEIEETDRGLLDVRIGGRRVALDLVDMDDVAEWLRGYVELPCEAELVQADGYRSSVVVPAL